MDFKVEIKLLPPEKIMYKTVATSLDKAMIEIPKTFDEVYKYLSQSGAKLAGKGYNIYHSMDMTDGKFEQECAFTVEEFIPETETIKARTLKGGTVATVLHKGPYSKMEPTYKYLAKWCEDNGYIQINEMIESSLNNPENPEDTLVEIIWPIEKKST